MVLDVSPSPGAAPRSKGLKVGRETTVEVVELKGERLGRTMVGLRLLDRFSIDCKQLNKFS